jgi:hypothetical protein
MIQITQQLIDDTVVDLAQVLDHGWPKPRPPAPGLSADVPSQLRDNPVFLAIFAEILQGLERADYEGLGAPWNEDAESTALFVWEQVSQQHLQNP